LTNSIKMDEDLFVQAMEDLISANLISEDVEQAGSKYRFTSTKSQEVVYEGLSDVKRRHMHSRVGKTLEEQNSIHRQDKLFELTHHYLNSNNEDKALEYSIRAGDKAMNSYASENAYDYYSQALKWIEKILSGSQAENHLELSKIEAELLSKLGTVSYIVGEWDESVKYYERLIELSEKLDDDSRLGAYRDIGLIQLNRNEHEAAIETLNKGLLLAEKVENKERIAEMYYLLGSLNESKGEFGVARKHFGESMSNAIDTGASLIIANSYLGLGRVFAQQGKYNDSIKSMKNSIEIFENAGDLNELAKAYVNLGTTYFYGDDIDESIEFYNKGLELSNKVCNLRLEGYCFSNLSGSYIKKNDPEKAISYLDKAFEIFTKLDEKQMISDIYTHYGKIFKLQQEWSKSIENFNKSIDILKELNIPYHYGETLFEFGLMYKEKDDKDSAKAKLKSAYEIFNNLKNKDMVKKIEKELEDI